MAHVLLVSTENTSPHYGVNVGVPSACDGDAPPTGVNPHLLARLQELEDLHSRASPDHEEAPLQAASVRAPDIDPVAMLHMTMTDLAWRLGANAERRAMLNFNLAVDIHNKMSKDAEYKVSEPILDWLPKLLKFNRPVCVADLTEEQRQEMETAQPLWSMARLTKFLQSQPRALLMKYLTDNGMLTEQAVTSLKILQGTHVFNASNLVKIRPARVE